MSEPFQPADLEELLRDENDDEPASSIPDFAREAIGVESLLEIAAGVARGSLEPVDDADSPIGSEAAPRVAEPDPNDQPSTSGRSPPQVDAEGWGKIHLGDLVISFTGRPGVPADKVAKDITPLGAWKRFFPDSVLQQVVDETNSYATKLQQSTVRPPWALSGEWPRKYVKSFQPTNVSEMRVFFAAHYLFGLKKLPAHEEHWSMDPDYRSESLANRMSRNRFDVLRALLHLQSEDLDKETTPKIGRWLDQFRARCEAEYHPLCEIAHDEQTVKHKGKWTNMTFQNKNKPAGQGFRIYSFNDRTGYTWTFTLDTRRGSRTGIIADILFSHAAKLSKIAEGHKLHMDNLFVTPANLTTLRDTYKINACGTWRTNHGFPKCLKELSHTLEKQFLNQKGMMGWASNPEKKLVGWVWVDSGVCKFLTTFHDGVVRPDGHVLRREPGKQGRTQIVAPEVAVEYNKYMGAVDTCDQLREHLSCQQGRNKKWWWPLFLWTLDVGGINAWVVYQDCLGVDAPIKHRRQFLKQLYEQLLQESQVDADLRPTKRARQGEVGAQQLVHTPTMVSGKRRKCVWCVRVDRDYANSHHTVHACKECNAHMHNGHCWDSYHAQLLQNNTSKCTTRKLV